MRNRIRSLWLFAVITSVFSFVTVSQSHAIDQEGKGDGRWKKSPPSCSELPLLRLPNAVILSATEIEGNASLPSHCLVYGTIEEEINFEVKLPSEWNRKLFM